MPALQPINTTVNVTPSSSTKAVNAIGGGGFLAGLLQIALGFVANVNQTGTHGIDKAVVWSGVLTALGSLATLAAKHIPIAVLEAKAKHYEGIVDAALTPYKPQLDQLGDIVKADPQFQEEWGKLRDTATRAESKADQAIAKGTGLSVSEVRSEARTEITGVMTALGFNVPAPAQPDPTPPAPAAPTAVDPGTGLPVAPQG